MNKVIISGRLTRDPEVRYSQGATPTAIARYTLAVDRKFKKQGDERTADFVSCISFGKTAEFAEKYLKQGTKIIVEGRLQTGSYTNKDGQKVFTTDVVVENTEFSESKNTSSSTNNNITSQPKPTENQAGGDGFANISDGLEDESLPFN